MHAIKVESLVKSIAAVIFPKTNSANRIEGCTNLYRLGYFANIILTTIQENTVLRRLVHGYVRTSGWLHIQLPQTLGIITL